MPKVAGLCGVVTAPRRARQLRRNLVPAVPRFAKGLKEKEEMRQTTWRTRSPLGVQSAYKAVMNPTEGTILTVATYGRGTAVQDANQINDLVPVFEETLQAAQAKRSNRRRRLLPVLKKAGVVDAGGKGLGWSFWKGCSPCSVTDG